MPRRFKTSRREVPVVMRGEMHDIRLRDVSYADIAKRYPP